MGAPSAVGRAAELTSRRNERDGLDLLIEAIGPRESRALGACGEPGAGEASLLDYLVDHASNVVLCAPRGPIRDGARVRRVAVVGADAGRTTHIRSAMCCGPRWASVRGRWPDHVSAGRLS